ncbi:shikimate kinase 3, chloroplastic-like [Euphorbia lathyris]|uniref:shikimate kinase 3, chloroplastic-like n=1 Tax=Euphorbia lathyris TaxID=212925 RepID=UPI003313B8AC
MRMFLHFSSSCAASPLEESVNIRLEGMEATYSSLVQFPWRIGGKRKCFFEFNSRCRTEGRIRPNYFGNLQSKRLSLQQRRIPNACKDSHVTPLQSENVCSSFDGNWLLKEKGYLLVDLLQEKGKEVSLCLNGCCIFLVGMMGSGKTTVGKILSESLNYAFVDSDKYVEQAVGDLSVAQIFQQYGENFFRDAESQALQKLSLQPQLVVATGGGAVVRPTNWKYMKEGISVFLDVPLDAVARRISAVGTDSRPLLHFDSGDPYTKAFMGLFTLSKKRMEAYLDADLTISLLDVGSNMGIDDVSDIGPAAIALEVLVKIQNYLLADDGSKSMGKFC